MGEYSDMGDHKGSPLQKTPKMCFPTIMNYESYGSFLLFYLQIQIHRQMVAESVGCAITFE